MPQSTESRLDVELDSETSLDELRDKFRAIVDHELSANSTQIAPGCKPHFNNFISSGVLYLLNNRATSRQITKAEKLLRRFTIRAIDTANSKGATAIDIQTFKLVKTGGMWCPPFCGDPEDE
ncbi:MAG TPA: hypothetical protein VF721_20635 [Pyrinomonadaceae bacterium]|jgi:hypothetical protein